jgi:hypothetical protein
MKNVHPPDGFSIADPAQIDLGCLQVLMSQNDFGYDLRWNVISAGIDRGMSTQIVRRYVDIQLFPESRYQVPTVV